MLRWCGDDDMNLGSPLECFGDFYRLIAGETHIRLAGILYPIDLMQCSRILDNICGTRGPFPAAAAMVMSVLLVIGRWSSVLTLTQILHTIRNTMKYIYSGLNSIGGVRTPRIEFRLLIIYPTIIRSDGHFWYPTIIRIFFSTAFNEFPS
jgi:hypothetical protein